jgi:hypothetical protein
VVGDFFPVDTISLRWLYGLFFIHHSTRPVLLSGITTNPTRAWVTQCGRNVTADLRDAGVTVKYVLRDRDTKFTDDHGIPQPKCRRSPKSAIFDQIEKRDSSGFRGSFPARRRGSRAAGGSRNAPLTAGVAMRSPVTMR